MTTIYANHYFEGEYPIKGILQSHIRELGFWAGVEIEGSTLDRLIDIGLLPKEQERTWAEAIQKHYGIEPEYDYFATIVFLQYSKDQPQENIDKLTKSLYDNAISIMDYASGDDDYYDYAPGAVNCIANLLEKLNKSDLAEELRDELESRGHND